WTRPSWTVGLMMWTPSTWAPMRRWSVKLLALIPAALLSALVIKDSFSVGQSLVLDARVAGFAVAVVATWRRAPLIVVVVLAAGATAILRAI
ncbi:MAG: AzlD domain-containing protein, partial [Actinomycetota bacterium]